MKYVQLPNNFGYLTDSHSNYDKSKVVILPVPYEKTTCYGKGTIYGPKAIIEASQHVELYDEELQKNICEIGICTLPELKIDEEPREMVNILASKVKSILDCDKFPVIIGGEHSITPGCVKAFSEKFENLSVLQIDAHADLREEFENECYSHACAMKRSMDYCKSIVQVGIRSLSYPESLLIKEKNLNIFWAKDIVNNDNWFEQAISKLNENVYITLDVDGLDPSIIPHTGTPEPGGLGYYQLMRFLKKVFKERNVVGFDIVELSPNENSMASDFTVAKMLYKMIGYGFFKV